MSDNTNSTFQRSFGVRRNNSTRNTLKNDQNSSLKTLKSAPADNKVAHSLRAIPSAPEPRSLDKLKENESKPLLKSSTNTLKSAHSQKLKKTNSDISTSNSQNDTDSLIELRNEVSELEDAICGASEAIEEYKSLYEIRSQELDSINKDIKDLKELQNNKTTLTTTSDGDNVATIPELIIIRDELLAQIEIDSKRLEIVLNKFEAGRRIQESFVLDSEQQVKNHDSQKENSMSRNHSIKVDEKFEDLLYIVECEYEAARIKNLELHQKVSDHIC